MGTTDETADESTRRGIEAFLDDWRVEKDIPGLSVVLVDGDGPLHAAGLGARDVEAKAPATPETRYPFASATKVVTALVVLQLVEQGEIALDDEIRAYVDYWDDVPGEPITVEELLTHSSGMPSTYGGERNYLFSDESPASPIVTRDDARRQINSASDRRITDEERFMYSDDNYTVLGLLIEEVAGRPFAEVAEENVLAPAGMDRSSLGYGELAEMDDAITGYQIEDGTPTPIEFDFDAGTSGLGPGSPSGLLAPVTEAARLVRCLLNGGQLDGTRILGQELVDAMCSHQAPTLEHVDGTARGCGYGPRVAEFLGERLLEHSGTVPRVGRAYVGWLPDRRIGVALGTNTPDVPVLALGKGVLAIVAGERPEATVPYLGVRRKTRAVAGTYESPRGEMRVAVEPADSEAYVELTKEGGGWSFPAFPESMAHDDYEFYTVWPAGMQRKVEFHDTPDGMELRVSSHRLDRTNFERQEG